MLPSRARFAAAQSMTACGGRLPEPMAVWNRSSPLPRREGAPRSGGDPPPPHRDLRRCWTTSTARKVAGQARAGESNLGAETFGPRMRELPPASVHK
jgi:hypothetical protein